MGINLCFVTDDNFVMPTCITITSILKSKKQDTIYNIYILCKNVSEENKNKFIELNEEKFIIKNIDLKGEEDFSDLKISGITANPTAIYKFFIPDILEDIDKVLFLDGDIIVQQDLKELYDFNINNCYVGAVRGFLALKIDKLNKKGLQYFNSGVLLMNLKKMREDRIPEKLLNHRVNKYNKFMDQDSFNFVLKDSLLILPFKYNTQMNFINEKLLNDSRYRMEDVKKYWQIPNNIENVDDIIKDAVILHFAGPKPWKFYDGYGDELWLKNYFISSYKDVVLKRKSKYISELMNKKSYKISKKINFVCKLKFKTKNRKHNKFLKELVK